MSNESAPEEKVEPMDRIVIVIAVVLIATFLFLAFSAARSAYQYFQDGKSMPPGYTLHCDGAGYYAFGTPSGYVWTWEDDVSKDKASVMRGAWESYRSAKRDEAMPAPKKHAGNWSACE